MAILNTYFDESGKQNDHPVVTFTGVCASQSRISAFDDAWGMLLRQYGLKSLHMAKASRLKEGSGPLMPRHQLIEDRVKALLPFADCINDHLEIGLFQAIDVQGFKLLTKEAKRGIGSPDDPHYLAFARGLVEVINYVQDDDKISLICDDDENTAWGCYVHYRAIRKVHTDVKNKIVALAFANDEYFPALQAADMVAFLTRLEAKKEFYDDFNMFGTLFEHLVKNQGPGRMKWFKCFAKNQTLKELGTSLGKLKPKK